MDVTEDASTRVAKSPIQAIDRGVALLEAIAESGPVGIPLTKLTGLVGLHASTGRTLLSALVIHGLVGQIEATRHYVLGSRFFELNRTYVLQHDLGALAGPTMRELWEQTQETVHLATLQHGRRVDISVLVSPQVLNVNPGNTRSAIARIAPLLHTAAGKVLLAGLDPVELDRTIGMVEDKVERSSLDRQLAAVRAAGYATNFEEEAIGVCGVAAPVHDNAGLAVAALCIGYPSVRHTAEHDEELRRAVVAAAEQLSSLLGAPTSTETRGES